MNRMMCWAALLALFGCDDDGVGAAPDALVRDASINEVRDVSMVPDRGTDPDMAAPGCVNDEDCGANQLCENSECVDGPPPPVCEADDDCPGAQVCVAGDCQDPPPECTVDGDCAAGQVCEAGACVDGPPPPECMNDFDCAPGQACENGACVDGPPPPDCDSDDDCAFGQICQGGACVDGPPPGCRGNDDCQGDEICQDGVCIDPPPPPQCIGNADCANGQVCVNGVCEDSPPPACAVDDDCPEGMACIDGVCRRAVGPGGCDAPGRIIDFGRTQGSTVGAAAAFAGECGGAGPEVVFELALPMAGAVCVDTAGTGFDTVLYVRAGDCVAGAEVGCNDDSDLAGGLQSAVTVIVQDDAPLFVFVDAFDDQAGDFIVNVRPGGCDDQPVACEDDIDCGIDEVCVEGECVPEEPGCAVDDDCLLGEACVDNRCVPQLDCMVDGDCAAGERCVAGRCLPPGGEVGTCDAPAPIVDGVAAGSTAEAEAVHGGACGGAPAPESVHTFIADADGAVCVSTAGSSFDTVLYVRTDCADAATEVGCNDDGDVAGGLQSNITVEATAGTAYFVFVDGFGAASSGDYVLSVTPGACGEEPPPVCADDGDCAVGERCVDGACVPAPECAVDGDCAVGEVCQAGVCVVPGAAPTCEAPGALVDGAANGATAGPSAQAGSCGGDRAPEAVHTFIADADGAVCVSTAGSSFDTVLYVRTDCADPATEVGCNDDGDVAGGLQSNLTVEATAGTAYFVFVDGFGASSGDYVLSVTPGACGEEPPPVCADDGDCAAGEACVGGQCVPAPDCANDEDCAAGELCVDGACVPAPECAVDGDCAVGEVCEAGACVVPGAAPTCEAPGALVDGVANGATAGPSAQAGACGGGGAPEAVHAFVADADGEVCVSTAGSEYDTVVYVRTDCGDPASEVACNDDGDVAGGLQSNATVQVSADTEYFVFVDGFGQSSGNYTLSVTPGPCGDVPPPVECEIDADCAPGEVCELGLCVAAPDGEGTCAAPIALVDEVAGDTGAAESAQAGACGGDGAPEVVHTFIADADGPVCVSTAGSEFDTVLYVRTDCADAATEVGCNDDGPGLQSELTIQATAGTAYFVFVDGFVGFGGGASGPYVLSVRPGDCAEPPPPDCAADEDCAAGESCVEGACVAGPQCGVDADCAAGEVCVDGACEGAPPACADDADCAAGEACIEGNCVPAGVPGTCADPFPVLAFGPIEGSTGGLPADEGAGCGGGATSNEAVYVFSVNGPGEVCLSTAGSAFDTVLHVREGDCDPAAEIACNDDSPIAGGLQSAITVDAAADVSYFVFVDGFGQAAGDYVLTVTPGACDAPPPACAADEDCAAGEACVDGACVAAPACEVDADCAAGEACVEGECAPVAQGTCEAPIPILALGPSEGTTVGAENAHAGACGGGGAPERVHVFAINGDAEVCLSTAGSAYDTVLYVREGACADGAEAACNDDGAVAGGLQSNVTVNASGNTPYFVFVDGFGARAGDYTLTLSLGACGAPPPPECAADEDCAAGEACVDGACVAGPPPACAADEDCAAGEACVDGVCEAAPPAGACAAPPAIELGVTEGSTAGLPAEFGASCGGGARGPESVFSFTPDADGVVCASTAGSAYDTVLYVREACDDALAEIACNDDGRVAGGLQSNLEFEATGGTEYFVFVDGFAGGNGAFTLNLSAGPCQ